MLKQYKNIFLNFKTLNKKKKPWQTIAQFLLRPKLKQKFVYRHHKYYFIGWYISQAPIQTYVTGWTVDQTISWKNSQKHLYILIRIHSSRTITKEHSNIVKK